MRDRIYILLIAIFFTVMTYFLNSVVFIFALFGLIAYAIYKNTEPEDRKFVLWVLICGFLLRIGITVVLHASSYLKGYGGSTSGDDLLYTLKGLAMVHEWEGKPYQWVRAVAYTSPGYGVNPFTFILAIFYKLNGFHPVSAKFLNCIMGALMGWVSYLIGKETFDRRSAKIAMAMVTFYPSLIRWSIANLKDTTINLLFLVCVYLILRILYNKIAIWQYVLLVFSLTLLYLFPQKLYFILAVMAMGIMTLLKFANFFIKKGFKNLTLLICSIICLGSVYYLLYINNGPLIQFIYNCEDKQCVMSKSDYAGYYFYTKDFIRQLDRGIISVPVFLQIIFIDVIYFMLTPFSWQMNSHDRIAAYPQLLLWYSIVLLSVFGFGRAIINKPKIAILTGLLLAAGIVSCALAEGNIGAAFRHRDTFTAFFIIFASTIIGDLTKKGAG